MSAAASIAPSGAQAMANVAQTTLNGQPGGASGPGNADAAQVQQFDALMQGAPAQANASGGATSLPGSIPAVQMQPGAPASDALAGLRTYGNELSERFKEVGKMRHTFMASMGEATTDPLMAMTQMMDFNWVTTTTLAHYQLTISVAQAANGVSHSLLNNQNA